MPQSQCRSRNWKLKHVPPLGYKTRIQQKDAQRIVTHNEVELFFSKNDHLFKKPNIIKAYYTFIKNGVFNQMNVPK